MSRHKSPTCANTINQKSLSKSQFAKFISEQLDLPCNYCKEALNYVTQGIAMAIREGYDIEMMGFGSFINSRKEPAVIKTPIANKEGNTEALYPARYVPLFRPSNYLIECATAYGEELYGKNDMVNRKKNK